ncbi:hypothetical protein AMTR_s00120p00110650 [Amborella trichopoda]|uniref:Uncharacterized protein n=1 Tax=Amborella trichopoda TaxID=13333 RepID=W1NQI6_AMBTC|nr:hypothetical protein AMTR_s00120p00110650 [Amborella trichopoda]
MKVEYTGSIVVVEEAIGIGELNWNPAPRRRRGCQNLAKRLAADLLFDPLTAGPWRSPRVGMISILNEDLLVEHHETRRFEKNKSS